MTIISVAFKLCIYHVPSIIIKELASYTALQNSKLSLSNAKDEVNYSRTSQKNLEGLRFNPSFT